MGGLGFEVGGVVEDEPDGDTYFDAYEGASPEPEPEPNVRYADIY